MRLQKAIYRVGLCAVLSAGSALATAGTAYPAADFKPSVLIAAPEAAKPAAAPLMLAAATTPAAPEAKPQVPAAKPGAKPAKGKLAARSAPTAEKESSLAGDFFFLALAVGVLFLIVTGNNIKSLVACISALLSKLASLAGKPDVVGKPALAKAEETAVVAQEECAEKTYGYSEVVKTYGYAEVVEPPPAPVIYGYAGNESDEEAVPAPVEAAAPVAEESALAEESSAEAAAPVVEEPAPVEEAAAPSEAPAEQAAPTEVAAAPAGESAPAEAAAPVESSAVVEAAAPVETAAKPKAKPTRRRTTTTARKPK